MLKKAEETRIIIFKWCHALLAGVPLITTKLTNMYKAVILSKEILNKIINFNKEKYNFRITKDILKEVQSISKKNKHRPILILIFVMNTELNNVQKFLNNFASQELLYRFVVFYEKQKVDLKEIKNFENIASLRNTKITEDEIDFIIENSFLNLEKEHKKRLEDIENLIQLVDTRRDQEDLISIGRSLSLEKNPDKLCRMILYLSKKITGADAGSIFLVEENKQAKKQLRFKYSHTFSKDLHYEESILPLDTSSIAGYVAVTGKVLNIPDVYKLSKKDPVSFNTSFDKATGYICKSMLVVPMRNHVDEVIGVIQLINSKEHLEDEYLHSGNEAYDIRLETLEDYKRLVVPFSKRYETLMEAVAGQAAIAIENNRMIKQIQHQFEEFVKASVYAIESRDEATMGHSFRVAQICTNLAAAVNLCNTGVFADAYFSETDIKELEYAALLHDYGKVYLELELFTKPKKLFKRDFDFLILKLNFLYRSIELKYLEEEQKLLMDYMHDKTIGPKIKKIFQKKELCLRKIRDIKELIISLNEPSVKEQNPKQVLKKILEKIKDLECYDIEGQKIEILNNKEKMNLKICRGSLNPLERKVIESHVYHTYNFVNKIPWPPEFKKIPEIAFKHHEKLDGTGYPNKLKGINNIPLQARMITIADIFDALTAADRPYKKAISLSKALAILEREALEGKIDKDLFELFKKQKIYKKVDSHLYSKIYSPNFIK